MSTRYITLPTLDNGKVEIFRPNRKEHVAVIVLMDGGDDTTAVALDAQGLLCLRDAINAALADFQHGQPVRDNTTEA